MSFSFVRMNCQILGQIELHVQERLAFWEDLGSRIEETLTVMEDVGDGSHVQRVAAEIERELFRMVRPVKLH